MLMIDRFLTGKVGGGGYIVRRTSFVVSVIVVYQLLSRM